VARRSAGNSRAAGKNGNFGVGRFVHGNSIINPLIREIETKRAKNSADLNFRGKFRA
jgi:hypothetical protein